MEICKEIKTAGKKRKKIIAQYNDVQRKANEKLRKVGRIDRRIERK